MQSMVTSFLRHWSMSTELKKATDCGRSCIPKACANILLWETKDVITGARFYQCGCFRPNNFSAHLVSRFVICIASDAR